jgi:hypothetical protein
MSILIISKAFACPHFKGLATRFGATPTFPEQHDQSMGVRSLWTQTDHVDPDLVLLEHFS